MRAWRTHANRRIHLRLGQPKQKSCRQGIVRARWLCHMVAAVRRKEGFDAAAIQEISRERRQAEGGFSAATIEESPRESSRLANGKVLDAATTQHAARERRREEGGLGMTLGATRERRRRSEEGTNVECSQARDLQVCYLNAQRANLDSEI